MTKKGKWDERNKTCRKGKFRKNCRKNKSSKGVRLLRKLKDEDINYNDSYCESILKHCPLKERKKVHRATNNQNQKD